MNTPDLLSLGANAAGTTLRERTLTRLYNALEAYRAGKPLGDEQGRAAAEFAPRLAHLHRTLDEAVASAYGWDTTILSDDEAL
ncbi:MAG: hypothetical protein H7Y11_05160, partial [Armatimonadetes bacterium]|nr:hypothetical protein [Anaerolineae bacterium]